MRDTELRVAFATLQSQIGYWIGYGRGSEHGENAWDAYQQRTIDQFSEAAVRRVCDGYKHWSFLEPVWQTTLEDGENTIKCPDDWSGQADGTLTIYAATGSSFARVLHFGNKGVVRACLAQYPDQTGMPEQVAEESLRTPSMTKPQKRQLLFFPVADQDYTVQVAYTLTPEATSGRLPFLYGGAELSSLYLDAGLAEADAILSNGMHGRQAIFERSLALAIDKDQKHKQANLGLNTDYPREMPRGKPVRQLVGGRVTWDGV